MSDIQLIQIDPVTNVVSFKLHPKEISGIFKLVQIIVLTLLETTGRDIINPEDGGDIPSMVGQLNIDPDDPNEVSAEVIRRVRKTEDEVIDAQINLDSDPEEKLREMKILGILQGATIDSVQVRIRVVNEAGRQADIVV